MKKIKASVKSAALENEGGGLKSLFFFIFAHPVKCRAAAIRPRRII